VIRGLGRAGQPVRQLFYFMGWEQCVSNTAWDRAFTDTLNNVHVEKDADFTQVSLITHVL